jgi:hypothetical protein
MKSIALVTLAGELLGQQMPTTSCCTVHEALLELYVKKL